MRWRRVCLLPVLLPWLAGCPGPGAGENAAGEEVLEIEDVTPPVDMELSTEEDAKGPKIVQGVAGVLPSDYPRSLPTLEPSTVYDFGTTPEGMRFVEFDSPTPVPKVTKTLEQGLRQSGWQFQGAGEGRLRAWKDGVEVSIAISELYSGSRILVEYR